jgi:hypothetical protein
MAKTRMMIAARMCMCCMCRIIVPGFSPRPD